MLTWNGDPDPLTVKLGPDSLGTYLDFTVLGCDNNLSGAGDRYLIVQGDATAYAKNYQIDGARKRRHMARAGEWAASPAVSSTITGAVSSTFDLRPGTPTGTSTERTRVALTSNLVGWVLQPDINKQVFAPITAVDAGSSTVTVGVDLASLAGVGKRWRTSSRQLTELALRWWPAATTAGQLRGHRPPDRQESYRPTMD